MGVKTLAVTTTIVATRIYQTRRQNIRSLLDKCKDEIIYIETRINHLSPDERERLRIAAHHGKCSSLEKLQRELNE